MINYRCNLFYSLHHTSLDINSNFLNHFTLSSPAGPCRSTQCDIHLANVVKFMVFCFCSKPVSSNQSSLLISLINKGFHSADLHRKFCTSFCCSLKLFVCETPRSSAVSKLLKPAYLIPTSTLFTFFPLLIFDVNINRSAWPVSELF